MTHEELCARARQWLSGSRRCNPVFSNCASCGEIPDAIGWSSQWRSRGCIVVECKTSVRDFRIDEQKYQFWQHPKDERWTYPRSRLTLEEAQAEGWMLMNLPRMGDFRFYFCEQGLITPEMVEKVAPDHGLAYRTGRSVRVVREAMKRDEKMIDRLSEVRYLRFAIINRKVPFSSPEEKVLNVIASRFV